MANLFQKNAYNALGLDTSASQKDINKRAKELINLLKIDEVPTYDTDIPFMKIQRSESGIQLALQQLTSPTKRISEYFYWFEVSDDKDAEAIECLKKKDIDKAQSLWVDMASHETAKGFIAKRNLAILFSILTGNGEKKYLGRSLHIWDDIVSSDKFWESFTKIYQLNDELGTNDESINGFRSKVANTLSDFYADVGSEQKDNGYISEFSRVFNIKSAKVEKDVLGPIFAVVNEASEKLSNLKISDEKIISDKKLDELKRLVVILRNSFRKLKEVGFYSDSQSKAMRDKAAEALRTVSLDLFNNLSEASKSLAITKIALEIAGTEGLKNRLQTDLNYLTSNIKHERVIVPINDLLEAEDWEGAFALIEKERTKNKNDKELIKLLDSRTKWGVTGYVGQDFLRAKKLYDQKKFSEAAPIFEDNVHFIMDNLGDFNFDQESIQQVLNEANRMSINITSANAKQVDAYRDKIIQDAEKIFGEQYEQSILVMLIDSCILGNLSLQIPKLKRQRIVKQVVGWGITIAIFAIIGAVSNHNSSNTNNSSNSSGSTGSSTSTGSGTTQSAAQQQACTDYTNLQPQINQINSEMNTYKTDGDTTDYNNLVPQQNSLVNQSNADAATCNGTGQ